MRRLATPIIVLALAVAGPASASADATLRHQPARAGERLAPATVGAPTPATIPTVIHDRCPHGAGSSCTWPGGPIYLDPEWADQFTFWHELGHRFDYQHMEDVERARFSALLGDSRSWLSSPNSPHEQFAEAYATCALGVRPAGGYGYLPPRRVHRRICVLIRNAR